MVRACGRAAGELSAARRLIAALEAERGALTERLASALDAAAKAEAELEAQGARLERAEAERADYAGRVVARDAEIVRLTDELRRRDLEVALWKAEAERLARLPPCLAVKPARAWKWVAVAGAIGIIVGVLIGR